MSVASAQEPYIAPPSEVQGILNKVLAKYKSMATYCSVGTIVSDMVEAGTKVQTTTSFTIKLKKPNMYLITWSQTSVPAALPQGGAVWSDGTQPYLYLLMNTSYAKVGDDVSALGGATAISSGASNTVPSLFFPAFTDKGFALARLKDPVLEKSELIGGDDCYVISGASNISKKETFWISKSSNLILRYEKSLEAPEGGAAMPEITDDLVEKSLKAMGQPVTDDSKKQMREMIKAAQSTLKNGDVTGTSMEMQMEITNPDFTDKDFKFTPPSGTTLTDSPMGTTSETPQQGQVPAAAGSTNTAPMTQ